MFEWEFIQQRGEAGVIKIKQALWITFTSALTKEREIKHYVR
jgi:hypothetical protein